MPSALLEAMACSCNIVASDIDVHCYLLSSYERVTLCSLGSPASVYSAVESSLENESSLGTTSLPYSLKKRAESIVSLIGTSER
jgi:hypothetical protein